MNRSAELVAEVEAAVVTVTSTVPLPAGLVAVICVSLRIVNLGAIEPKETALAPANPVPVIVTVVPPACGPLCGVMPVTLTGAGAGGVVGGM